MTNFPDSLKSLYWPFGVEYGKLSLFEISLLEVPTVQSVATFALAIAVTLAMGLIV